MITHNEVACIYIFIFYVPSSSNVFMFDLTMLFEA